MEAKGSPALARTTTDQVGLVFRTKMELYYFLSMECKQSILHDGVKVHWLGPEQLRPAVGNRGGVEQLRAQSYDMTRQHLPSSIEDHRHALPPSSAEGSEEGKLPWPLAGAAKQTGAHCCRPSRWTPSRKPLCHTFRDSALSKCSRSSARSTP